MLVIVGLTGEFTTLVRLESTYQVTVPLLQVANKDELSPWQIVEGMAEIPVGAVGVGLTVIETFPDVLLHPRSLTQAT